MNWKRVTMLASTIVSALGIATFAYSMTQQTKIQLQMNQTMIALNQNVKATIPLVKKTSDALTPLVATTTALSQIETQEQHTVSDLRTMNAHLKTIGETEVQVLVGMNALYQTTSVVRDELGSVASKNQGILDSSNSSATSAGREANDLGQLNQETSDVIAQLHKLNTKLAALKLLP